MIFLSPDSPSLHTVVEDTSSLEVAPAARDSRSETCLGSIPFAICRRRIDLPVDFPPIIAVIPIPDEK